MSRRGVTRLAGILLVDKPAGLTSHDVVSRIRKLSGEGRVGHAGTLDPMATGLLVVLVGPYTRLEPYLSSAEKAYRATIAFGSATDTDDAEGSVIATGEAIPELEDQHFAQGILDGFLGSSNQRPPAYSAIKLDGAVAHRAARAGTPLDLPERPIEVLSAELLGIGADNTWDVAFRVSKGTYIRALARDIGERVAVPAHLSQLRRTASGALSIEHATALSEISDVESLFVDPLEALGLPVVSVDPALVEHGSPLDRSLTDVPDGARVAIVAQGELRAIYEATPNRLMPRMVLPVRTVS